MIVKDFDLKQIAYSGQCFRFDENEDGSFNAVINGKVYIIKQEGDSLLGYSDSLFSYFDLGTDYSKIKEYLSKDEILKKAINYCSGMRILNQDLWEMIVSFIISQNNNIPRIKSLINNISKAYGKHIEGEYYDIPSPNILANLSVEELMKLKLGYRAEYLIESAKRYIALGYDKLDNPKEKFIEDAKNDGKSVEEYLMTFKGIGPKVANCISLFGLHMIDSFPIDVWVKRVMNTLYNIPENDKKGMLRYAKDNFSPYSGIAQQYLFYYIRMKDK